MGRWRIALAFFCSLGVGAGLLTGGQDALAQNPSTQFLPFSAFLQSVRNAAAINYVGVAGNRVGSAAAFEAMRQYILDMYRDTPVVSSFVVEGHYYDCIPIDRQPTARILGIHPATPPPTPRGNPSAKAVPQVQQRTDEFGDAIGCTPGNIPMRRITLEDLSRFETLDQFFKKEPAGAGQLAPPANANGHNYAVSSQIVSNYGGGNTLNLWSPLNQASEVNQDIAMEAASTQLFSLSQNWTVNVYKPNYVQTVESGWQAYPQLYGATSPVLFIYWTADNYSKTGCYNLTCAAFMQTNNNILLGSGWANYSVRGGAQFEIRLQWQLYQGNWWLAYGYNDWVGYYPGTLWQGGGLALQANEIEFGGETVGITRKDGFTYWPRMGSGSKADMGYRQAAYQRQLMYVNTQGVSQSPTPAKMTTYQSAPFCYTYGAFTDSATRVGFYFGGPGGLIC